MGPKHTKPTSNWACPSCNFKNSYTCPHCGVVSKFLDGRLRPQDLAQIKAFEHEYAEALAKMRQLKLVAAQEQAATLQRIEDTLEHLKASSEDSSELAISLLVSLCKDAQTDAKGRLDRTSFDALKEALEGTYDDLLLLFSLIGFVSSTTHFELRPEGPVVPLAQVLSLISDEESKIPPPLSPKLEKSVTEIGDKKELQQMKNSLKERTECQVCMERDIDATLYPCGHRFMCSICAKKIMRGRKNSNLAVDCPVCRNPVSAFLTSYVPRQYEALETATWWKCSGCAAKVDYTCQGCSEDQQYSTATAARNYSSALERHLKAANAELSRQTKGAKSVSPKGRGVSISGPCNTEVRELQDQIRVLRAVRVCVVCFARDSNVVFFPCGHSVLCSECSMKHSTSRKTNTCFECDAHIEEYVAAYQS